MKKVSIAVPIFNEQGAIAAFIDACSEQIDADISYEIVFIDDGSTDCSAEVVIRCMNGTNVPISLIQLSRNFGKEAALTAGLDHCIGDAVIPMDVDLQDPPALINDMVEKWLAGADVVLARRISRLADSALKRLTANMFYKTMILFGSSNIPENVGDFRLIDRKVVDIISQLKEKNRFMKGIMSWPGFNTEYVDYERPKRSQGVTKFGLLKLAQLANNGFFAFSSLPLKLWTLISFSAAIGAFLYMVSIMIKTVVLGADVPGYASTMSIVLFFNSVVMVGIGLLGDYISRVYDEVKGRPIYVVKSIVEGVTKQKNNEKK